MDQYIIISYSYPPSSAPGAHRPYQLARVMKESSKIKIFNKYGASDSAMPISMKASDSREGDVSKLSRDKKNKIKKLIGIVGRFVALDKASFWGVKVFPSVLLYCLKCIFVEKKKPVLWATTPVETNVYLASVLSYITTCKLHIDIRDAPVGVGDNKAIPFLTRLLFSRASTVTTVSPSLCCLLQDGLFLGKDIKVIYNGTDKSILDVSAENEFFLQSKEVVMTYAGALYGGERPVELLLDAITSLSSQLDKGIKLKLITRENVDDEKIFSGLSGITVENFNTMPKSEALRYSANSHINIVLIGSSSKHACGIPLKVFDLLGIGRPILIVAPEFSDAVNVLKTTSIPYFHLVSDCKQTAFCQLAEWVKLMAGSPTIKVNDYMAPDECRRLLKFISPLQD